MHDTKLTLEEIHSIATSLIGKWIVLDYMNDPFPVANKTIGYVSHVDNISNVHVIWETGSSLALIPETDKYHIINIPFEIPSLDDKPSLSFLIIKGTPWIIMETSSKSHKYQLTLIVNNLEDELLWCKEQQNFATFEGTLLECINHYYKIRK